eukprot:3149796-Alexandrium_andersonii.AAC.1
MGGAASEPQRTVGSHGRDHSRDLGDEVGGGRREAAGAGLGAGCQCEAHAARAEEHPARAAREEPPRPEQPIERLPQPRPEDQGGAQADLHGAQDQPDRQRDEAATDPQDQGEADAAGRGVGRHKGRLRETPRPD